MLENKKDKKYIFTEKQISDFAGLYHSLKKVHIRLINEGYTIKNGEIIPPKNHG